MTSKYCRFRWDRETAGAAICLLASTYQALRSLLEGSHPTAFCSQFVAKCYEEAGEPYQLHYKQPVIPLDACAGDGERSLLLEALEEIDSGELNIDGADPDGYEENFMIQELSENVFDTEKHGAILLQSARDAMAALSGKREFCVFFIQGENRTCHMDGKSCLCLVLPPYPQEGLEKPVEPASPERSPSLAQ